MMKIKVLLAEDEPFLGRIIKESLETRDFEVRLVEDGAKAYSLFKEYKPDICVFDVNMPEIDGFSLTIDLRKENLSVPIIFLTARSLTEDVVKGFEIGGNDYLKKPFSMEELIVRIKSLLSRNVQEAPKNTEEVNYTVGMFYFSPSSQELSSHQELIRLSTREASLLELLVQNKNKVLDKRFVLKELWGDDTFYNARSMDVYMTKLRKHLSADPGVQIVTIRGKGYRLIV